jgi:hypothetical protein
MPFNVPDTREFPWDSKLKMHLAQAINPMYGGLNSWSTRPTVGVDNATLGVNHKGYTGINTLTSNIEQWDGSSWVTLIDSANIVTSSNISFYLNATTGSDTNSGLSPTTPLKTGDKLYQLMRTYNFQDRQIVIYLGPGSYVLGFPANTTGLPVAIVGESSNTVTLKYLQVDDQRVIISNLTISDPLITNGNSYMVRVLGGSLTIGPNIVYGNTGVGSHMLLIKNAVLSLRPNCPITVTHKCQSLMYMFESTLELTAAYVAPGGSTYYNAPPVSKGTVNQSFVPALTTGEVRSHFNFVGSEPIYVVNLLLFSNTSIFGQPNAQLAITGPVTGRAYQLLEGSALQGGTCIGLPTGDRMIGFPNTVSAGTMDATSSMSLTRGI